MLNDTLNTVFQAVLILPIRALSDQDIIRESYVKQALDPASLPRNVFIPLGALHSLQFGGVTGNAWFLPYMYKERFM